MMDFDDDIIR